MVEQIGWPQWWHWELEVSDHLQEQMDKRGFNETDLRTMLHDATSYALGRRSGRWEIETGWHGRPWEVVVEPDPDGRVLVVVTAYEVT